MNKVIISVRFQKLKKLTFILTLLTNIGILFYFKYYNFFIENINSAFHASFNLIHIVLPLGISFFTFQQLSYIIDSYHNEVPDYNFLDYALYVSFFPQLIAGPIVTHNEMIPQFANRDKKRIDYENLARGLMAFAFGLAKKVLIADTFGKAVNWGYQNIGQLDTSNGILIMLFYTLQIYFDFSGYCDMATGIALMFNIELPMNFNSPYRALTIVDFWKRWHITLTRFFTRYLYIPLGGGRKGMVRTYINIMIIFLVSGLWHGANWTFIIWGAMHGIFSIITKIFSKRLDKLHPTFKWVVTFTFVNVTWIYFRADSLTQANILISKIMQMDFGPLQYSLYNPFYLPEFHMLAKVLNSPIFSAPALHLNLFLLFSLFSVLVMKNTNERIRSFRYNTRSFAITSVFIVWSVLSFSGVSTFLYFNF